MSEKSNLISLDDFRKRKLASNHQKVEVAPGEQKSSIISNVSNQPANNDPIKGGIENPYPAHFLPFFPDEKGHHQIFPNGGTLENLKPPGGNSPPEWINYLKVSLIGFNKVGKFTGNQKHSIDFLLTDFMVNPLLDQIELAGQSFKQSQPNSPPRLVIRDSETFITCKGVGEFELDQNKTNRVGVQEFLLTRFSQFP